MARPVNFSADTSDHLCRRDFVRFGLCAASFNLLARPVQSASGGSRVLTVDGEITKEGRSVHFSDGDISDFQQAKFSTSTIWTDDSLRFSRPCLATLLSHAGAGSGDVVLRAENDYDIRLPREMVAPDAPIIANRIDGAPSSMRDQRPLWLVFPYDSNKRYRTESIYAFSVWQLIGLSVLPE